ncbi:MAG: murein L,D-transpeptidase catalytic domain family protein [Bacteroidetes bacterium]|nr:murein L,D-transpeptidase catalytic domain family protein [Bacteroidota bacterium]
MQRKCAFVVTIVFLFIGGISLSFNNIHSTKIIAVTATKIKQNVSVYDSLNLSELGLSKQAFTAALKGYQSLVTIGKVKNDSIISIIDFSLPSTAKRLFVINIKNYSILFNTYVSHGKNSGTQSATSFSNKSQSFKSSLGFYVTSTTYFGKHGYSLKLEGEEKGFNDNAYNRGIVMHSAAYVSEDFIKLQGRIGRSEGCPAVPEEENNAIIETIKGGTCLFMYAPNGKYLTKSKLLHQKNSGSNNS